ncbi:MAG: hypothetical protein U5L96_16510 [Owenweeksia sp.]|nr:hypothetical protein [Owenweeksia sp.]
MVGDTLFSNQLITDSIFLTQAANYTVEFYATSDSITKANNDWYNIPDTLNIDVNDSTMSMDFNHIDNYVGGDNNLVALAVRLHLKSNKDLKGVYTNISGNSDSTGSIIV